MNHKNTFAAACSLALGLALAGPAHADQPSYTYVEAGYVTIDLEDPLDSLDGFTLAGSLAVTDHVHVFASYLDGDTDFQAGPFRGSVDLQRWAVGAGLNYAIADGVDAVGRVAWVKAEADADVAGFGAAADEDGYAVSAGLRAVRANWDLEGAVVYTDVGEEGDTTLDLSARYYFGEQFSVGPTVSIGDDTGFGLAVRFQFD
jgi:hypothetical protein